MSSAHSGNAASGASVADPARRRSRILRASAHAEKHPLLANDPAVVDGRFRHPIPRRVRMFHRPGHIRRADHNPGTHLRVRVPVPPSLRRHSRENVEVVMMSHRQAKQRDSLAVRTGGCPIREELNLAVQTPRLLGVG